MPAGDRNINPFTSEKIEAFAPIPNASVSAATSVKPGLLISTRVENLRSCRILSIVHPSLLIHSACGIAPSA